MNRKRSGQRCPLEMAGNSSPPEYRMQKKSPSLKGGRWEKAREVKEYRRNKQICGFFTFVKGIGLIAGKPLGEPSKFFFRYDEPAAVVPFPRRLSTIKICKTVTFALFLWTV